MIRPSSGNVSPVLPEIRTEEQPLYLPPNLPLGGGLISFCASLRTNVGRVCFAIFQPVHGVHHSRRPPRLSTVDYYVAADIHSGQSVMGRKGTPFPHL